MFYKVGVYKIHRKTSAIFFNKAAGVQTGLLLTERYSGTDTFLWILQNFWDHLERLRATVFVFWRSNISKRCEKRSAWENVFCLFRYSKYIYHVPKCMSYHSYCGDNREGTLDTLFSWLHIYIRLSCFWYIYIYIIYI